MRYEKTSELEFDSLSSENKMGIEFFFSYSYLKKNSNSSSSKNLSKIQCLVFLPLKELLKLKEPIK